MFRKQHNATPYVLCVVGCSILVLTQRSLPEPYSGVLTALIFFGTILASAISGGWKPGLTAAASGILSALFLFSPTRLSYSISHPVELLRLASFFILGTGLSVICELLRSAWLRNEERQIRLQLEIEQRLSAQLAEQARADELMTTLANIGDGIIRINREGLVTFLNPVAEDLVGYKTADAKGRMLSDIFHLVHARTREPMANPAGRALAEGIVVRVDHDKVLISREGTERLIDDSATPIRGKDGTIDGAVLIFRDVTERIETRKALRDQEQRATAILESITEAFFSLDRDWRFTYINGPAGRLWQRPPESLIGRSLWDEFPGLLGSAFETIFRNAMDAQLDGAMTAYYPDHDCYYEVHTYPAPDGVSAYFHDVSDRKRTESERNLLLREVESERARLAEIFRHAPSFMCVLSGPEHVIERANDRYLQLIGGREVIGQSVRKALPEVQGQGYLEMLDRVYESGEPYFGTDHRVTLSRGGRLDDRIVDFVYQPIRNPEGAVTGVLVQGIDLTDRKKAESDLVRVTGESERQRRMFETALSNTPDFVYLFDVDGHFTYANRALLTLWGKHLSEITGKRFSQLDYPSDLAQLLESQIQDVVRTKQPIRDEVQYTSAFGTRHYEHIFVPVFGAADEVEAVAGSSRDITDRNEAEETLREAGRKKDDFLALLAHELRNPLAPIRNGLQVLQLSEEREVREQSQAMMDRQLTHMVRLIDDLLDVSRINRDKMELRRSRILLTDIIESAIETARPAINESAHELIIELPEEPIFLNADLTRLAQVFSNLLINSAKYTLEAGKIRLVANRSENEVTVTVADNGIGIPADSLSQIFDMFSQVNRSIDRNTGGLGIGLSLVKGLVEMHGGSVAATSEGEDCGSQFTVRLPILGETPSPAGSTLSPGKVDPASRRILVVDDNQDSTKSMSMMLKLLGHEVALAHDGIEAIERAEAFRPEVILMDVGMPRLNGLDAARRVREQPWGQEIKIFALTGWGQDSDRTLSQEAGCNGHLVKPVSPTDLENMLSGLSKS